MARRKRTPEVSTLTRQHTVAYARKQKGGDGDGGEKDDDKDPAASDAELVKAALATMKAAPTDAPADRPTMPPPADHGPADRPTMTMQFDPSMLANAVAEPEPARGRVDTVGMPTLGGFGAPPEIPSESSPGIVIKGGAVEDPTHMPGPRDIPPGDPDDVASPPGYVPKGDSRSLRRRGDKYEFALVYRRGNAVISRVGIVGTRGVWRVVEYPTTASASNAYAREASRFVTDGFSDYRE
jgi:hypothetical protein